MQATATLADGSATEATAQQLNSAPVDRDTYVRRSLELLAQANQDLKDRRERYLKMEAELIAVLEDAYEGHVDIGRKHFHVVRAVNTVEHHDEATAIKIAKRLRMLKRFTKTVVDWTAVRAAIDSGLFPEMRNAVQFEDKPKRPYIKIS